ncbi:MAG: alanine--tRNA ligase [Candidatus Kaiserbacteria bacterium]|nr:alanine--tRNA ligase [Candidatus Kaiserbacteria bacterium]
MRVQEVRERYLQYLSSLNHHILPSASLIPQEDATTLFTGSGMQPLVPYLLGKDHQAGSRLTGSQKCFRANDIDEVGDLRHTTFFEMLGNWSLGDYFKEEQIRHCFHFLTDPKEGIGLDPQRLYVTVFSGDAMYDIPRDDESVSIWQEVFASVGIEAKVADIGSEEAGDKRGMRDGERIFFYDGKKNWWSRAGEPGEMPVGEVGGPDTEVFYDVGSEHADPNFPGKAHPNTESGQFFELCNSVFMQYVRTESGFAPLPKKNIDFGGGLERMAAATEQTPDIFMIDVFKNMIDQLVKQSDVSYQDRPQAFRIIADHVRSALFLIADGVQPSNTDRGYVLRRLIRSALYQLRHRLAVSDMHLSDLVHPLITTYRDQYPEVAACNAGMCIEEEERRFEATLAKGMKHLNTALSSGAVSGDDAFSLQSTYGFPVELTEQLAGEAGISVDREAYETAMKQHRDVSRSASQKKFKGGLADTDAISVRYHTATHLLHQALRDVLGDEVLQKGSNITPDRLRFDFSFERRLTDEEKQRVEAIVNEKIKDALPVTYQDMSADEAEKVGAIGVFSYGDTVRVYSVGDYSREYCGGPHVENTAELGVFRIKKEEAVSSGIRRIRAVLD